MTHVRISVLIQKTALADSLEQKMTANLTEAEWDQLTGLLIKTLKRNEGDYQVLKLSGVIFLF